MKTKRIERRVMNGGGPVTLAVELRWEYGEDNGAVLHTFVNGDYVMPGDFDTLLRMLALPQGPAL